MSQTVKNIVISRNFLVWKFYEKAQFPQLCLSTKFIYQEIRWNYDIFRSVNQWLLLGVAIVQYLSENTHMGQGINGPSRICERQPLKNLKWYRLFCIP